MRDSGGPSAAAAIWARRELRAQWRSLVALGLLAGLTATLALTAVAGARRSATAFDRLRDATDAADAVVFASNVGIATPDWTGVSALPYVEAAGSFGLTFSPFVELPPHVDPELEVGLFTVASGEWRTEVDRPIITAGRDPDPTNPHEMLGPPEAAEHGIGIGDEFVLQLPSDDQIAEFDLWSPPQGELVTMRVVGFGRSTFETAVIPWSDGEEEGAGFIATPAFHDRYVASFNFIDNLLVRFRPGQGSVAELERDARRLLDSPSLPVLDAAAVSKRVTNGTGLEASGLALFGLAMALAGSVLIGQALVRSVAAASVDASTLRELGMTRREAARALALPHLASVAVAVAVGTAGAWLASPRIPIGLSRSLDPIQGFHADWLVLSVGVALMAVVLVSAITLSALRAASPAPHLSAARGSRVVGSVARAGAPPPVVIGTSLALEAGRDRRALPTRPALAGVVVGVLGITAALTLVDGMRDAIDNPSRFGTVWDLTVLTTGYAGVSTFDAMMDDVDATEGIEASAAIGRSLVVYDGVTQPTYALRARRGDLSFTLLDGRAPAGLGEVAFGPESARSYGVGLGDDVWATDSTGSDISLRVVGIALLITTPHSSYDQGAWISADQQERLAGVRVGEYRPGADGFAGPPIDPGYMARLAEGMDHSAFVEQLNGRLDPSLHGAAVPLEPIDSANLRRVSSLPLWFALFTLLVAVGAVGHVCASVVRRRAGDLAVLRALGLTPGGARSAIGWQARTLAVAGLVVGIPVGVVVGRLAWRAIAETTPLVFVAPLAPWAIVGTVPAALIIAAAVAWRPGRRVARLQPAEVLRRE